MPSMALGDADLPVAGLRSIIAAAVAVGDFDRARATSWAPGRFANFDPGRRGGGPNAASAAVADGDRQRELSQHDRCPPEDYAERETSACPPSARRAQQTDHLSLSYEPWARERFAQPASRGSSASSFSSVSASSASGSESATMPPPGEQMGRAVAQQRRAQGDAELAVLGGVHPADRARVPAAVHAPRARRSAPSARRRARRRRPASGAAVPASSMAESGLGELGVDRRREVLDVGHLDDPGSSAASTQTERGPSVRAIRADDDPVLDAVLVAAAGAARRGGRRPPGRRCGASNRRARPCDPGPAAAHEQLRAGAQEGGLGRADAEAEARREQLAQGAEHGRRVVCAAPRPRPRARAPPCRAHRRGCARRRAATALSKSLGGSDARDPRAAGRARVEHRQRLVAQRAQPALEAVAHGGRDRPRPATAVSVR